MTKAEWQSFYRELRTHARAAVDDFGSIPGQKNVAAVVVDARTGAAFRGARSMENIHPVLQGRLQALQETVDFAKQQKWAQRTGYRWPYDTPGIHEEINALNQALWAREAAGLPLDMSELWMAVRWGKGNRAGQAAVRCGYCQELSSGVNVVTDSRWFPIFRK
jgi:hypothetical protein